MAIHSTASFHNVTHISARSYHSEGTSWVTISFYDGVEAGLAPHTLNIFGDRIFVARLAQAINTLSLEEVQ